MHDWLAGARDNLAAALGEDGADYDLSDEEVEKLLDIARVAAHESKDRTNAPLLTYLLGLASVRHPDRDLSRLGADAIGKPIS